MRLFTSLALVATLASAALTGCVVVDGTDANLNVTNSSDFTIEEIYVTDVGSTTWGPNLLSAALLPGDALTINVDCGTYDALLVDEANVQCEVHHLDLCYSTADWDIRNTTCAVFGARMAERQRAATTLGDQAKR
ncbi:MAG: hypothetical protein NT062_34880 [Proteobacteria bacterium]|nr:hypothetical protein [Pseudomonadota bacterium]